jgi:hypothetical protein
VAIFNNLTKKDFYALWIKKNRQDDARPCQQSTEEWQMGS